VSREYLAGDAGAEGGWPSWGLLLGCFFLSGATGLVYEVVWLRLLGLIFGHTVHAITTVLAAFMAGLALGSFLFARWAGRIRNPIRAYGWLEIGIGAYCALLPVLLWLASFFYLGLHRMLGLSFGAFSLAQFLIVSVLLLTPTTLMGGTLPVLSQALVRRETGVGRSVGVLYAVNTLGAVAGVALAGYALLPMLGNRTTIAIAAIANVTVGVVALMYGRGRDGSRRATVPPLAPGPAAGAAAVAALLETPSLGALLTVTALGVSGAVSMVYEVAWTRALALVIGSSTYAFTSMLVAFLVGIAGGSAVYSWLWGARRPSPASFAAIQTGLGLTVGLTLLAFPRMPDLFLAAVRWSDSPSFVQLIQILVSAGSLLPSTLLIGATFPCAVAVAARATVPVGEQVGRVYAANTLGAIAGTVLAGFALIPAIGVHASIKVGVVVNLLLAIALFAAAPRLTRVWRWGGLGAALLTAMGVVFVPPWNQRVMTSGPAVYAKQYLQRGFNEALRRQEVLFYRDGISATVSVLREGAHLYLRVNGKTDASTGTDMPTQLMSGHLPLLLHPEPHTVLVIGLGSGITAGAIARYPITRLDVVELEPAVVEASRFFAEVHRDVLTDPRVHTVVADGRNFLLTTSERYDVIASEPSNPWIGGMATLFSVEFFQLARAHLRPGGIMLQWLQGHNLDPADLRTVVRTFRTAFPATSIWNSTRGDYLLLGRAEPTPLDLNQIKTWYQMNPGLASELRQLGIRGWSGVLGYFMLGEKDAARLATNGGLNTDDRLPLEFSAPRALYVSTTEANWQLVRSFKIAELPPVTAESRGELEDADVRYGIGMAYLSRNASEDALPHFARALQLDPQHAPSMLGASAAQLALGHPSEALQFAKRALAREPRDPKAYVLAGRAAGALNAPAQAVAFLEQAFRLDPADARVRSELDRARGATLRERPLGLGDGDLLWLLGR
jgi:spermidine synthase